jgi:hypothetical protein
MAKYTRFINDEQWKKIEPYYLNPKPIALADQLLIIEKFWKAFYGSCDPAADGRICQSDTPAHLRVGAD